MFLTKVMQPQVEVPSGAASYKNNQCSIHRSRRSDAPCACACIPEKTEARPAMHLFLKLHQLAAARGDGLRPEWLDLMTRAISAEESETQPPVLTVVQPGNHPEGDSVASSAESIRAHNPELRKARA